MNLMYKALSPGAIGVKASTLEAGIEAAKRGGFEGVEFNPSELADRIEREGAKSVRSLFEEAQIHPACFGLPVEWRGDAETFEKSLAELPRLASAAGEIGCFRTATWIMPCSEERDYETNYAFHVERFRSIAATLNESGISLGLEFIGPKTLRESQKYPFLHTMGEMLKMGEEIGGNVGLLLDCWHLYTSGETLQELEAVSPERIVYVHVNDAPAGVSIEDQVDSVRDLPGATGVIDIAGFLKTLQKIGYRGPVTPEPFQKSLASLPDDEARLKIVGESMNRIFAHLSD